MPRVLCAQLGADRARAMSQDNNNLLAIASKNGYVVAKQANIADEKFTNLGVDTDGDGTSLLIFVDSGEPNIESRYSSLIVATTKKIMSYQVVSVRAASRALAGRPPSPVLPPSCLLLQSTNPPAPLT